MTRHRPTPKRRHGVTLLEVMTAVSLSATMMASSFMVLRSTYAAWEAHESDLDRAGQATATLKHLTRCVRQAEGIAAISTAVDTSGSLSLIDQSGSLITWDHQGTSVTLTIDSGSQQPLADEVLSLTFEGYQADGTTLTTDPDEVQAVRVSVTTQLPSGASRTMSSFVWVRSW